jgi:hypothetical protein
VRGFVDLAVGARPTASQKVSRFVCSIWRRNLFFSERGCFTADVVGVSNCNQPSLGNLKPSICCRGDAA